MPYEMDRATFDRCAAEWREHGEVTSRQFRDANRIPGSEDFDYLSLSRACSRETVEVVAPQLLALALKTGAYYVCGEHGGGFTVTLTARCVEALEAVHSADPYDDEGRP